MEWEPEIDLRLVEESPSAPVPVIRDGRRHYQCPLCSAARTPAVYETRVECWSHMRRHRSVTREERP